MNRNLRTRTKQFRSVKLCFSRVVILVALAFTNRNLRTRTKHFLSVIFRFLESYFFVRVLRLRFVILVALAFTNRNLRTRTKHFLSVSFCFPESYFFVRVLRFLSRIESLGPGQNTAAPRIFLGPVSHFLSPLILLFIVLFHHIDVHTIVIY